MPQQTEIQRNPQLWFPLARSWYGAISTQQRILSTCSTIFQWDNLPRKPSISNLFTKDDPSSKCLGIRLQKARLRVFVKRAVRVASPGVSSAKKSLKRRGTVGSAAANPHNARIVRNGSTNLRMIYVLITVYNGATLAHVSLLWLCIMVWSVNAVPCKDRTRVLLCCSLLLVKGFRFFCFLRAIQSPTAPSDRPRSFGVAALFPLVTVFLYYSIGYLLFKLHVLRARCSALLFH